MPGYTTADLTRGLPTTALLKNQYFSTGDLFEDVSDNNQKRLLLSNPSDSDFVLFVVDPTVRANGQAQLDKTKNATIDTTGNAPETGIVNKNTVAETSVATVQVGGDNETGSFSGGDSFSAKVLGAGGSGATVSPGSAGEVGATNIIQPGGNLVLSATAINGPRDVSIDADFLEYPLGNVP